VGPGRNPDPIALGGDSGLRRRRYLCQAKDALVTLKRSGLFATMFPMAKSEGVRGAGSDAASGEGGAWAEGFLNFSTENWCLAVTDATLRF